MAITHLKTLFTKDINKNLFPKNSFYQKGASRNDSSMVNAEQVVLYHAGSTPTVRINDAQLKREAVKREDFTTKYDMVKIGTDPTAVTYNEDLVVDYSKRASVLEEHHLGLKSAAAQYILDQWAAPAAQTSDSKPVMRTTGADRPATYGTGTRKSLTLNDLHAIRTQFMKDDVVMDNICAVITPEMHTDLLKIKEVVSSDFSSSKNLMNGAVGYFLGINFFVRSKVNVYDNTATPVLIPDGAALGNDTNEGALFYCPQYVRWAHKPAKVFYDKDDARHKSDIMSTETRVGAAVSRKDGKGVIRLIEAQ